MYVGISLRCHYLTGLRTTAQPPLVIPALACHYVRLHINPAAASQPGILAMWQCSLMFLTFFFTAWTGQGSGDNLFVEVGLGRLGRKGVYVFICRTKFEFEFR